MNFVLLYLLNKIIFIILLLRSWCFCCERCFERPNVYRRDGDYRIGFRFENTGKFKTDRWIGCHNIVKQLVLKKKKKKLLRLSKNQQNYNAGAISRFRYIQTNKYEWRKIIWFTLFMNIYSSVKFIIFVFLIYTTDDSQTHSSFCWLII